MFERMRLVLRTHSAFLLVDATFSNFVKLEDLFLPFCLQIMVNPARLLCQSTTMLVNKIYDFMHRYYNIAAPLCRRH